MFLSSEVRREDGTDCLRCHHPVVCLPPQLFFCLAFMSPTLPPIIKEKEKLENQFQSWPSQVFVVVIKRGSCRK